MFDGLQARYREWLARARRVERRELREFRRWLEHTGNLVHVSVLVFVPLLVGAVTYLSHSLSSLSFLVFPPLASGTYTLFADPESDYASPTRFVVGLTLGALCGWAALSAGAALGLPQGSGVMSANAVEAALAMLLTGVLTWPLHVEEASAYSTALLALLVPPGKEPAFAASVFLATLIVAGVFSIWRETVYEQRARYLYETVRADDHVLVPFRGEHPGTLAMFAGRIAAAHDAGKVVLVDVVDDEAVAAAEQELLEGVTGVERAGAERVDREAVVEDAEREVAADAVDRLERQASRVETKAGVPCDVLVAVGGGSPASVVRDAAREANCDLIVAPYEEDGGRLSPFVQSLFGGDVDVVALRTSDGRDEWSRVMVTVRRAGNVAHAMVDFALRLAGKTGSVSVCRCIDDERQRRAAEETLADVVETFAGHIETRVANERFEAFVEDNAPNYDLIVLGASTDRSRASRLIARPTFYRLREVDCDVAVVHRP